MSYSLNERTKEILDAISEGVILFDPDLTVRYANRTAEHFFGALQDRELTAFLTGFVLLEKNERLDEKDWPPKRALREGFRVQVSGFWEREGAEAIAVQVVAVPMRKDGAVDAVLLTVRNVTPQLALERELREFIAITSHQFRTPLATISWLLEVLLAGKAGELPKEQWALVQQAREAAIELIDTVQLILNASRIELGGFAISPEPRNLGLLLKQEIDHMQIFAARKDQKIILLEPKTSPTLLLDEAALRFVVSNLLSNAIKFTPEQGSITVKMWEEARRICVSIEDTGVGIPAKDQKMVFTKFFRAENVLMKTGGTGLGLYIVKQLLKRVGGDIWFESKEGRGATFVFSIPREGFRKIDGRAQLEVPTRPLY